MIDQQSQGLPILPVPEDARQERILAMLLGETDPAETAAIQAEITADSNLAALRDQLAQATESFQSAFNHYPSTASDEPKNLAYTDERREAIVQALNTPTIAQRRRRKIITFSHPLVGIGVAACFLFVFFIGYLPQGNIKPLTPNKLESETLPGFQERETKKRFSIAIPSPEPAATEEDRMTLNQLEMLIAPGPDGEGATFEMPDYQRVFSSDEQQALQLGEVELGESRQFGYNTTETLAGTRLRTDLKDLGSSITISNDRFLTDTATNDIDTVFRYEAGVATSGVAGAAIGNAAATDGDTVFSHATSTDVEGKFETLGDAAIPPIRLQNRPAINETAATRSEPSLLMRRSRGAEPPPPPPATLPETPVFGASQSSTSEEEIFELSPFEVDASDGQGYRSTNTLAGSRNSSQTSPDPTNYTFSSTVMLKDVSTQQIDTPTPAGRPHVPFSNAPSIRRPAPRDTLSSDETASPISDYTGFTLTDGLLSSTNTTAQQPQAEDHLAAAPTEADLETQPTNPVANPSLNEYPEITTSEDPLSTFSLSVSDVSYRLAESYLAQNTLPPPATLRAEEFINAFDYGDATPTTEQKIGFAWEHARWPFSLDREVLRISLKTAASGRGVSQPLNLVIAIDTSGSMSRPDRVEIVKTALAALGENLAERDHVSIVTFDREARLQVEGASPESLSLHSFVTALNPQGGTDLESGLNLAYQVAARAYDENAINRVILLTDGAANLGNIQAEALQATVEQNRRQGIALDCFGIGFDGHNDAFLEQLSRNGDGRYRFLNDPENARSELGQNLAGQLRPAVYDVKVQVEFNPDRVTLHQQLGYQQHRLKHEDFRDNAVDAAELGAAEAGVAVYIAKVDPNGRGDLGFVRARFRDAATGAYKELSWNLPYSSNLPTLEKASPKLRLAATAAAVAAKLNQSPFAEAYEYSQLFELARDFPQRFPSQHRAQTLPQQILKAANLTPTQ